LGIHERGGALFSFVKQALFTLMLLVLSSGVRAQTPALHGVPSQVISTPTSQSSFRAPGDLRQVQSQGLSQGYSFQNLYQEEGLAADPSLNYRLDPSLSKDVGVHVSLAVGHLGCQNFTETVIGLGANLRAGIGGFGNTAAEAKMYFYSQIRDALKLRFPDAQGAEIRSRIEESFLLLMDSASTLDFANPASEAFVSQLAMSLQNQYQNFVASKGWQARFNCGLNLDNPVISKTPASTPKKETVSKSGDLALANKTKPMRVSTRSSSRRSHGHGSSSSHDDEEDEIDERAPATQEPVKLEAAKQEAAADKAVAAVAPSGHDSASPAHEEKPIDLAAEQRLADEKLSKEKAAAEEKAAEELKALEDKKLAEEKLASEKAAAEKAAAEEKAFAEAKQAAEDKKAAEAKKIADEKKAAEEVKAAEIKANEEAKRVAEQKKADEKKALEEKRLAQEKRLLAEKLESERLAREAAEKKPALQVPEIDHKANPVVVAPKSQTAPASAKSKSALLESFVQQGVPRAALSEALESYAKYRALGKVRSQKRMVVMDLTRKTRQKRFWVLDMETGKVVRSSYVGHGSGNGLGASNPQDRLAFLSNEPGSNASTWGAMLLEGRDSESSKPNAVRLEGLDSHNSNMGRGQREIKIHSADDYFGRPEGSDVDTPPTKIGRSSGCPVLYPEDARWLGMQVDEGSFMYTYKGDLPVVSGPRGAKRAIASIE
jgi:hypothetical protein